MTTTLSLGTAKVRLEYPEGFFPHKSFRGRYFTGVKDELYARALYLDSDGARLLLLSVELGDISDEWLQDIAREAGLPVENVFFTATHTHAAPHACGTWPEDVKDLDQSKAFAALCKARVLQAARQARQNMRSARMRYSFGRCDINVNRDYRYTGTDGKITAPYIQAPNHGGISDKTVAVLKFEDMEGRTIAYFVNYAIHSNVTFYQTWTYEEGMLVTGDLAGIAMQKVEERSDGGTIAMFTMGAAADQMPQYLANHRVFDKHGNARWEYYGRDAGYALADAQGSALATEILRIAAQMEAAQSEVPLRLATEWVTAMGKQDGVGTPPERNGANTYAEQYKETVREDFHYTPTEPLRLRMGLARLGPVVLVAIPAEIVTSIGAEIKCAVSADMGLRAMILTQCNGSYSYISDERGYQKMTFEALASHFMPGAADKLLEGLKRMMVQLKG